MSEPTKTTSTLSAEVAARCPTGIPELFGEPGIAERLRDAGIPLTLKRLAIAHVMLAAPAHLTADEVLSRARRVMPEISRATVYNTLKTLKEKGLLREIIANAEHVVFDSTTSPHHHFYNIDSGEVTDIPDGEVTVVGTARLPADLEVEYVEVVVRVRRRRA
jgi:Fur family transcriptional regulator, iron response regulator